ncbi:MAG TPA: Na/Pi cotransporter family protein, partial [Thiothrix sp.]|nr:Na/Pi cotransporter family protein [Thiothrix sp.]
PLFVYLLMGVIFTAIIQSSSAAMMLTLNALHADIIPLPAAAALVIGADLGTTSTVLLGSLQGAVAKRRLAMAQVLFNLSVDTLAFIALLPLLGLIAKLQIDDPLYALVAFHSLFNLLGLFIFLPFIQQYTRFLERWIKEDEHHIQRYIHNVPVTIPEVALEAVIQETRYLLFLVARLNLRFLRIHPNVLATKTSTEQFELPNSLKSASKLEHYIAIKELEGEIVNYALKIPTQENDNSENNHNTEQLTQDIDGLIKASRSAIYSAKALKDIDADLESFHADDNEKLSDYFELLKTSAQSMYKPILSLIINPHESELIEEELIAIKQASADFHNDYAKKIYKEMSKIHLTSLDLSTLLNVNKEMYTSEKVLVEALEAL